MWSELRRGNFSWISGPRKGVHGKACQLVTEIVSNTSLTAGEVEWLDLRNSSSCPYCEGLRLLWGVRGKTWQCMHALTP